MRRQVFPTIPSPTAVILIDLFDAILLAILRKIIIIIITITITITINNIHFLLDIILLLNYVFNFFFFFFDIKETIVFNALFICFSFFSVEIIIIIKRKAVLDLR